MEVVAVHVVLMKDGRVVEEGDAVRDEFNRTIWRYTTRENNGTEGMVVLVRAVDRPGNVTEKEIEL